MSRASMTRIRWTAALIFLWALAGAPAPASAQGWFDEYRTFSLLVENDALAKWQKDTTDDSYTQGLRMNWEFGVWPGWADSIQQVVSPLRADQAGCSPAHTRTFGGCGMVTFGLAQTIYSPVDIMTPELQREDQPFAGHLFATVGVGVRQGRWQSQTELLVGVTGPPSIARDTQSMAHWSWSQGAAKPGGWDNQLKSAVHIGAQQNYVWHLFEKCLSGAAGCSSGSNERRIFDLSPRSELVLSTAMVRASAGAVLRLGYGFPDAIGQRIGPTGYPFASDANRWWGGLFATADERYVAHNAFLSGSYADGGPDGWRTLGLIAPRRHVNEQSVGLIIGNKHFAATVEAVFRALEWDPMVTPRSPGKDTRHSYLSFKLSLNSGG